MHKADEHKRGCLNIKQPISIVEDAANHGFNKNVTKVPDAWIVACRECQPD